MTMCRYGEHTYKDHYACFGCRKVFRKQDSRQFTCPNCGEIMANMGKDFAAPRSRNRKQWLKVELLFKNGVRFSSCGCTGPGYRPKTLRGAYDYLSQNARSAGWGERKVTTKPAFLKKSSRSR